MNFMDLPPDMVREIIKYTPWSNRLVSKNFQECVDENNARVLYMELTKKSNTPFFNGSKFTSSKIPFAAMLKSLQLNDCKELEDIAPLVDCTTLDTLGLARCLKLKDISPLVHCSALTSLDISSNCDIDVRPLANMKALSCLFLDNTRWLPYSMEPISNCTGLKNLNIDETNMELIPDTHTLSKLIKLETLCFDEVSNDLTPLMTLSNLYSLYLTSDVLYNVQMLSTLVSLKKLSLHNCSQLEDLSPLSSLTKLEKFELICFNGNSEGLSNALSSLKNLKKLQLASFTGIGDIEGISQCPSLQNIKIVRLTCVNIDPLSNCTSLIKLTLFHCTNLVDIHSLKKCTMLEYLRMPCCNHISDISPLTSCVKLAKLSLSSCMRISDISPLSSCIQLTFLDISRCSLITDVIPLSKCKMLCELNMQECKKVIYINLLANCKELVKLNIVGCPSIVDIGQLANRKSLTIKKQ